MIKIITILLLVGVLDTPPTKANNQLSFSSLNTSNGLKHNGISEIIQDHLGFIWFGTENGLHRFDGEDIKVFMYKSNDSTTISGNVIYDIFEDKTETLWIATNGGLCRFNRKKESFTRIGLTQNYGTNKKIIFDYYVPAVVEGKDGEIFVSWGNHGIWKYNDHKKALDPFKIEDKKGKPLKLNNINIIEMFIDSENLLWMGSKSEGLFCYNPRKDYALNYRAGSNNQISSNFIYSIAEDKHNRILVSSEGGLDIFNKNTRSFSRYTLPQKRTPSFDPEWIWNIETDRDSNIWLCSNRGGLHKIIDKEFRTISYFQDETKSETLNDNNIQCFLEDDQGNIWVGTQRGGVNYAINNNSQAFKTISRNPFKSKTLSHNRVTSIVESRDSLVFIGTDGGGLNVYDRNNQQFLSPQQTDYPFRFSKDAILTLYIDQNQNLWSGGFLTGLNKYSQIKKTSWEKEDNNSNSLSNNDVRDIFVDSNNNFWVATNGGGLNLFHSKKNLFEQFSYRPGRPSISSDYTLTITEDSSGYLWLGTYEGLDRIDMEDFSIKNYSATHNISGEWIYSLLVDSKGQLWVGTNMGLHRYDESSDTFIDMNDSIDLPNEIVSGLLEDNQGNIWISTSNGLACYELNKKVTKKYFHDDGLPSNFFNPGAAFKNKSGLLFFGSSKGLVYFDPKDLKTNTHIPPVYITDYSFAPDTHKKHHINSGDTIVLDHKQASSVNIYFCALNYINAQRNNYAYQLEGIDEHWNYVDNQKFAIYTNLDPGQYKFRVKASNNDNYWNEEGDMLHLKVIPPFWRTDFAYALYSLAIIMLLALIWRYTFLRTRYTHKLRIQRLKAEKAEEMAQLKTNFFVNISHELSTPLTLILTPVEKMIKNGKGDQRLLHIIRKNALSLMRLINELLDTQKLEEEQKKTEYSYSDIVLFVKEISNEFSELASENNITIHFSSETDSYVFPFSPPDVEKIVHNLISNAIKYNNPGGKVDISMSLLNDQDTSESGKEICIKVSDSGQGINQECINNIFDRYYRVSDSQKNESFPQKTGFGIGLYLTKKLVEFHKGHIHIDSKPGEGTTFTVHLPYITPTKNTPITQEKTEQPNTFEENKTNDERAKKAKNSPTKSKSKPSILVAEDNSEICNLLKIILSEEYSVFFAANGQEAIEKTNRHLPDVIVADIMMPIMDGIELCKRLKKDFNTSHIPVIMLTALNSGDMMVKGLNTGADDYVSKPFNPDVLLARIKNLIESRKTLQKKYLTDLKTQPSEMALSSADELFLDKLNKLIEEHLDDSDYEVSTLASEMNMSSITLYRKIKSLTGQSVNPFIRAVRIKRAASLLQTGTMSITEVAQNVGFNDVKYFRKCFFKQFGQKPSEFNRQQKENHPDS